MHIARKVLLASTLCLMSAGTVSSMNMCQDKFCEESNKKNWKQISLSDQQKTDLANIAKLFEQSNEQEKTTEELQKQNGTIKNELWKCKDELNDATNEKTIMHGDINRYVGTIEQPNKEKNNDLDNFTVELLKRKLTAEDCPRKLRPEN